MGIDAFHDFDSQISADTKTELTEIEKKIGDGSIPIKVNGE